MRTPIKRSLESFLVAGVLAFSGFGAVTQVQARGGGGHGGSGDGYFVGITGIGGGVQGGSGGFEAQNPAVRPEHGSRPGNSSCNPYFAHPMPAYCRNQ